MIMAAVEAASREEDDLRREALQVVSAFKVPSYRFNPARKTYHLGSEPRPLHGSAKHKVALLRDRFSMVQQRLARNPQFRRPVSARAAATTNWVELTSIETLRSKEGELCAVLGMLVPDAERAGKWCLEDLNSRVPVELESCQRMPGLYTESTIVLAQGEFTDEGVFAVGHIGLPPAETRTDSLLALGVVDQYQVLRTPQEWTDSQRLEQADEDAVFLTLVGCAMDSADVRRRLRRLFQHYDSGDDPVPRLLVLTGPFHSTSFAAAAGARKAFTEGMERLAEIFAAAPRVAANSHVVIVPDVSDPGSANVLPRPPLPELFCRPLRRVLSNLTLGSNPCRILYHTQEIVVFRGDTSARMRRHCVIRPKDDILARPADSAEGEDEDIKGGAAAATPAPAESREEDPDDSTGLEGGPSETDLQRHVAASIVSQAHLCPLPLHVQPVFWAHDVGLRLFPLPDILVLADDADQFLQANAFASETTVICPGVLSSGQFCAYTAADRTVELCNAEPRAAGEAVERFAADDSGVFSSPSPVRQPVAPSSSGSAVLALTPSLADTPSAASLSVPTVPALRGSPSMSPGQVRGMGTLESSQHEDAQDEDEDEDEGDGRHRDSLESPQPSWAGSQGSPHPASASPAAAWPASSSASSSSPSAAAAARAPGASLESSFQAGPASASRLLRHAAVAGPAISSPPRAPARASFLGADSPVPTPVRRRLPLGRGALEKSASSMTPSHLQQSPRSGVVGYEDVPTTSASAALTKQSSSMLGSLLSDDEAEGGNAM